MNCDMNSTLGSVVPLAKFTASTGNPNNMDFCMFMVIHELSKSSTITCCVVTDIVYVTLLKAKRSGIKA